MAREPHGYLWSVCLIHSHILAASGYVGLHNLFHNKTSFTHSQAQATHVA